MKGLNFFGQLWWSINGINIIYFQRTVKLYCCTRQCTDSILVPVGNAHLYQFHLHMVEVTCPVSEVLSCKYVSLTYCLLWCFST